jgi:glycosyltransferase involved in cell wall biosynthesis
MIKKGKGNRLFIIFSLTSGGTQRMLVNVLNEIATPHKKKILFLYNYYPNLGLEQQLTEDVKIYKCETRNILKHLYRFLLLLSIIRKEKISRIVSFAKNGTYHALIAKVFFPFRNISIIYRMVSVDSELIKSRFKILKRVKYFIYINVLCRNVNMVIGQSNYMTESFVKKNPKVLKNKVTTIQNLLLVKKINAKSIEPIEILYDYFIFIGRLSEEKNVTGIIEAFKRISDNNTMKLVIIGEGYLKIKIVRIIKSLGLNDKVVLLGYQKNPYKYLAKAKALVLFSRFEGMPNVVLESMICKTPVIVSDFEGVEDIVIDKETGYIVQRKNIEQLSKAMLFIIQNPNRIQPISENAYQFAKQLSENSISNYSLLINK